MTFLPSVNNSTLIQKANSCGGFSDAIIGTDYIGQIFKQTATKTVTNTTSETTAIGTGIGNLTLAANFFSAGRIIRIDGGGVYSAAAITPGTLTVNVKLGSTVIATAVLGALVSGAATLGYNFESIINCWTTGASGTVGSHGMIDYNSGLGRNFGDLTNNGVASTIDTTTSQVINVTVQWQTASTSNIVLNTFVTVEVL